MGWELVRVRLREKGRVSAERQRGRAGEGRRGREIKKLKDERPRDSETETPRRWRYIRYSKHTEEKPSLTCKAGCAAAWRGDPASAPTAASSRGKVMEWSPPTARRVASASTREDANATTSRWHCERRRAGGTCGEEGCGEGCEERCKGI